ncbi:MAG TPA: hypothetical protein VMS02_09250, partial [Solirubrobacteraceae bacterium]|nr:hypothetical protein [Solirubrobacteraceae bacterium]
MAKTDALDLTLLPGARELLALHARALPQRDDLCGAFCGALALGAAGLGTGDGELRECGGELRDRGGEPLDQDAVALAAGSTISPPRGGELPHGEPGRRDYRLALPELADSALSGTTAGGVVRAIGELSGGELAAIPYGGPWSAETLDGLFDLA